MNRVAFLRACKFAVLNFWRNIWLSVVTVIILTLTLFSLTFFGGMNLMAKQAIQLVKEKVDVSVYFANDAADDVVQKAFVDVQKQPDVEKATLVSRDQALQLFRDANKGNETILETLGAIGSNPFGAIIIIKAKNLDAYPTILTVFDNPAYAKVTDKSDFQDNVAVVERLTSITHRINQAGALITILFIIIAILVIFNTIRITIYTYREEIGIMKLVGATNWFIRAPFIIESVLYAVLSGLVCMVLLIPLVGFSAPYINQFFAGYDFNIAAYFASHFWSLFGTELLVGMALAIGSSSVAITRYMRR